MNPARSTGTAVFVGGWALAQLWLFWLAPLVGGALAGLGSRVLVGAPEVTGEGAGDGAGERVHSGAPAPVDVAA